MGGDGFPRTENPRAILQAEHALILAMRVRQAPDDPIGLRYPIRVYQSGPSSVHPLSTHLIETYDDSNRRATE
jgi:hypothetical protein